MLIENGVVRGCWLGCAIFISSSSILKAQGSVSLIFVLVHYLPSVVSVFLSGYPLSGVHTALEPRQRDVESHTHFLCLHITPSWDTHFWLTQTIWPNLFSPECRCEKLPRYNVSPVLHNHAHTTGTSSVLAFLIHQ